MSKNVYPISLRIANSVKHQSAAGLGSIFLIIFVDITVWTTTMFLVTVLPVKNEGTSIRTCF